MPPKNIRTVRQLIYWEYAKLIAGSVVKNRKNYAFVMHCYKKMDSGQITPSTVLRENKLLVMGDKVCVYCEVICDDLQWEHIIPRSLGGADTIDNMVLACKGCNLSKGTKDVFEWYGKEKQYEIPRLVLGKYLKLIFELHEKAGTLDAVDLNADGALDVVDLGAVLATA